jgi:flagellar basal-body rod modification protein FlgD
MTAAAAATTGSGVVSGTTALPPGSSGSGSDSPGASIAGNFNTFLTILTTQLQNQNPLDPLDTNQFTQQLVQFAGVEQQLKTNDQLTKLISAQQSAQSTQALQFVGKAAFVDGDTTNLINGQAGWYLDIPSAGNLDITITDKTGQTVYSNKIPVDAGENQFVPWDGKGLDGTQWADGSYKLTATGTDFSGKPLAITTQIGARVDLVDLTQSPPLLSIGGQKYTIDQIKRIGN